MQRPSRTCVQNTSMTNHLPSQQSVRCDFYSYWHREQILIHSVYWHFPPFQIKAIRGCQTKLCNFSYKYTLNLLPKQYIQYCTQSRPYLVCCAARSEQWNWTVEGWLLTKVVWYKEHSVHFPLVSGPIEQLPDYNRIRSGMYWMRTWELALSLDT